MRIMIVLSCLQGGGAERVATLWCGAFAELGHDVLLATNKEKSDAPFVYPIHEKVAIAKCFGFHNEPPSGWKSFMLRYAMVPYKATRYARRLINSHFALRRTIKSFMPDVIISLLQPTSTQALVASWGLHCPVIATEHNAFERPECAPLNFRQKFFKFTANKWFKAVTVLTEADRLYIGNKLKNVYVMPNPLAFEPISRGGRTKRIVAAGRLDAWHCKGFDLLIRVWGKIAEKYPEWIVDIAGESHLQGSAAINHLEQLIEDNGVKGRCVLSGFHSDMAQYFRDSEIFVLSSRYEGFGMVLIEAMSQGCACIACDYKGRQREILRNESEGLCIPIEDENALMIAMEKMINDEQYRRTAQESASRRASDYSPIIIAHKWEEVFSVVLDK